MALETLDRPKVKKVRKSSTEAARQMYLYGEGDGIRVIDVMELSKLSGASDQTIRMRLPEWQAELEVLLAKSSKLASPNNLSIISLPEETLEGHRDDIIFFRGRLDKCKAELTALPSIISELKEITRQFASDPDTFDQAIALLDRTLRLWANEKSLTKLVIDLKNIHDQKCGLDSLKSIQESTSKAIALAQAKEPSPQEQGMVPVASGVFKRRG